VIEVRGLTRRFRSRTGDVDAVAGVDFDVAAGEIVGLLGPNGAGKTTTLRMLATLLRPTAGTAVVAGADLVTHQRDVRRHTGYVAQVGAPPAAGTRLAEELVTQARLQGFAAADATQRVADLLVHLDLTALANRPLAELSGGQRRRFDLALGLVHQPRVVLLDEPTTGLDPQSRARLWQHIRSLRDDLGVTLVLTTHYLDEADALADRLLVMDHGRVIADGHPGTLKGGIAGDIVTVRVVGDVRTAQAVAVRAAGLDGAEVVGEELVVAVEHGDTVVPPLLRALHDADVAVRSVHVRRPTLDDVFLRLTGHTPRDD